MKYIRDIKNDRRYVYAVYRVRIPAYRNTVTGFRPSDEVVKVCLRILDKLYLAGVNLWTVNLTDDDSIIFEFYEHANIGSKSLYRVIEVFGDGDIVYLSRDESGISEVRDINELDLMGVLSKMKCVSAES